jgi:RecB family endonuclease NucS
VRLLVARCEVRYSGRLNAVLPEAVRLLIFKADGSVLVHDDAGGFKPLNWMTAPTFVEDEGDRLVVRKLKTEDVLEIRLAEVLSDVTHDMGESAALQKDGVERDLQEELAAAPTALGEDLMLVKREWPTDVGPVDLMCRDESGEWVAVEIKRIATIEAVEQLTRYLGFIREDPAKSACRGILAAQKLKPQAIALAESRGIRCVEVDLALLRGEREPDLTLFTAGEGASRRAGSRWRRRASWQSSCIAARTTGRSSPVIRAGGSRRPSTTWASSTSSCSARSAGASATCSSRSRDRGNIPSSSSRTAPCIASSRRTWSARSATAS